ncbi:MAG: glycosyltransferase family 39 protein [Selenomonadaceae bacterium]|nr:glycosyltransferase family 39 protein [Selenomonadaceae bacterium]
MDKANPYPILFGLCLVLFFLGSWLIPVTDPTESCYTLTAKEMLEAGDFFSPRIHGNFWYDKPIFFYWELILAYGIFGVNEFASRFFPAVFATCGVMLTYYFGNKLYGHKVGLFAAVLLAATPEFWYLSHAIITDMTLFCAISVTLMSFYFGYTGGNTKLYYISYVAVGIGMLTKGPIAFCLPGLIIFLFLLIQKDLKHLLKMKLLTGIPLAFAIAAVWYVPMYIIHGQEFIDNFFGVHNFLRATVSEHPKFDVWYYYTVIFLLGFFPYCLPVIYSLVKKFWRERRLPNLDTKEKFLLTWALTVPIVFQSFATKYVTYTLPYMMPVAILFAGYFVKREKIFYRMAAAMIIFLTAATFIAIPICEKNSGKELAEVLVKHADEETCVVSYGYRYSYSLVYYSGLKIWRLEKPEDMHKVTPQKMQWSSLNVMPIMTTRDLPDKKIIAIVDSNWSEDFLNSVAGTWVMVDQTEEHKIFNRLSRKEISE